jgi:hypothetical protein
MFALGHKETTRARKSTERSRRFNVGGNMPELPVGADQRVQADLSPHDILVRTVNVRYTPERYGKINVPRLPGIAKRFRLDHPDQVGLIGVTEPTRNVKQCQYMPGTGLDDDCTATRGFEAALQHEFNQDVSHYHNRRGTSAAKDIGILMGSEWKLLDAHSRRMGVASIDLPDMDWNYNWARKLQMVLLRHLPSGLNLRFYCTHFTPGDNSRGRRKRIRQAERLLTKILGQFTEPTNDLLPPIVVGDFNARRQYGEDPEKSVEMLEKHFRQPLYELYPYPLPGGQQPYPLIDQVLIGRQKYWSHIKYDFKPLSRQLVRLTDRGDEDARGRRFTVLTDDGFPRGPLSDHNYAEGFLLRIYKL